MFNLGKNANATHLHYMLGVGLLVFKFIYYTIQRDRRTSGHLQPVEANSYTCSFLEPPVPQTKGYHTISFAGSTPLLLPSSPPLLPYPYALLKPFSSAACASYPISPGLVLHLLAAPSHKQCKDRTLVPRAAPERWMVASPLRQLGDVQGQHTAMPSSQHNEPLRPQTSPSLVFF